ncbi:amino acid transporter [Arthrobacter sp. MYb227]|uniref:APC family permease n=1 Tax=Arthrobacter sp. MYb227 TaxID=1848601 RepID=UPI000CFC4ADA|nr:APC family permease [Arthrobacter sp. MYb227]PQZ92874.1 amino acid transporter [Arthrobacter sp. MYb227]
MLESTDAKPAARLAGKLGPTAIVFMVVAAAAPLTVIGGNMPLGMGLGNGAGAPVGFLIAALVLLLFSVGFVAMTPHVREAGAFYSYVTEGLGRRAGLGIAFVALVSYTAIQAGIYGYIGWAVDDTVRFYGGPEIPWPLYSLLTLLIVAALGYRHIDLSAKVLGVALVLEIGVVLILNLSILANPGPEGLSLASFEPSTFTSGSLGVAVLFALTGFIGFEAAAIFRDEARDPSRTIPRATYIAVFLIGAFYAFTCWMFVVAIGPAQVGDVARQTLDGEANMLLDTTAAYLGTMGRDIVNILLLTSLFACVLSFHNVITRYQLALSRKGHLPAWLDSIHPHHKSPARSSIVQTGTALILLAVFAIFNVDPLVGVFGSMAGVATVGMVILLWTTTLAVIVFFRRGPGKQGGNTAKTLIVPILALAGLSMSLVLVLANFTLVTGSSLTLSILLGTIPFLVFVLGMLRSRHVQRRDKKGVEMTTRS